MKRAFTLIELLVVIAIIAILAAILFPVFAQAKEQAYKSVCLSNLKQVGLGVMMYVEDYDETYPPSAIVVTLPAPQNSPNEVANWKSICQPYIKNHGVFACPKEPAQFAEIYLPNDPNSLWWAPGDLTWIDCSPASQADTNSPFCAYAGGQYFTRGLTFNGSVFGVVFNIGGPAGQAPYFGETNGSIVSLAAVSQSAETVLVCDTVNRESMLGPGAMARCWNDMGAAGPGAPGPNWEYPDPTSPNGFHRSHTWWVVHNHGVQFAYADGHAKYTRTGAAYARNDLKFDCQKLPTDDRTWPDNSFSASRAGCRGPAGQTPPAYTAAQCIADTTALQDDEVR